MKKLVLHGAGVHGKVFADLARLSGWKNIIFFDSLYPDSQTNGVLPIHGTAQDLLHNLDHFDEALDHICSGVNLPSEVSVAQAFWVGIGSAIRQGVQIGYHVRIGAGSVVVKDVADNLRVAGNPA